MGNLDTVITVPPGAVSEPVQFAINPMVTLPPTGGFQMIGQGFEVTAMTTGGTPVTQFNQPITLVIHYTDADVAGIDESQLTLHYWDETQMVWVTVPGVVDIENNTLTVMLDHLTLFALLEGNVSSEQKLFLPAINR